MVGQVYIIEWPYKLLAPKYMIYEVGLLGSLDFKNLLVASTYPLQFIENSVE